MAKPYVSNYDKFPIVHVSDPGCEVGWASDCAAVESAIRPGRFVICVECYPGCYEEQIEAELAKSMGPQTVIRARDCYFPENPSRP